MKKIALLLLILVGCNKAETPFSIEGNWQGTEWYCTNSDLCWFYPQDSAATLSFSIQIVDKELQVSDGDYFKPSCASDSHCFTFPWVVDSASYENDFLYIHWTHNFRFEGKRIGEEFDGKVIQELIDRDAVWNNTTIERN